jgi:hypothetical protein
VAGGLALILALVADHDATEVSQQIVERVGELIENFVLLHGLEFYGGPAVSEPLQRLASWILTSGKTRIVASDLTVNVRDLRGLGLWDLNRRLSPMVAGGWLTPESSRPRGQGLDGQSCGARAFPRSNQRRASPQGHNHGSAALTSKKHIWH